MNNIFDQCVLNNIYLRGVSDPSNLETRATGPARRWSSCRCPLSPSPTLRQLPDSSGCLVRTWIRHWRSSALDCCWCRCRRWAAGRTSGCSCCCRCRPKERWCPANIIRSLLQIYPTFCRFELRGLIINRNNFSACKHSSLNSEVQYFKSIEE